MRVLLVEDYADGRELFQMVLEGAGHDVTTAADGLEAVSLAGAIRPEAALIDISIPGLSGHDVARHLRGGTCPEAYLIAITSFGSPEDVARSHSAGFDLHLTKPIHPDELLRALEQAHLRP